MQEAGGFATDADESYVNQAQRLSDGAKLVIPTVEQVEEAAGDSRTGAGQIGIVEQAGVQQAGYGVSDAGTGADGSGIRGSGRQDQYQHGLGGAAV